jgi:DNA polymerase-1
MAKRKDAAQTARRYPTNIGALSKESVTVLCQGCAQMVTLKNVRVGQVIDHSCGKQFDIVWWRGVTDPKELECWLADATSAPSIGFDFETTGLSVFTSEIVGVSFCREDQPYVAIYVPMRHQIGENMDPDVANGMCGEFVGKYPMVAHNAVFEAKFARMKWGVKVNFAADSQIESWLDDPNRSGRWEATRGVGLKDMANELWDLHVIRLTDLIDLKQNQNFSMVDTKRAIPYGCQDSDFTIRLKKHYTDKNKQSQGLIWRLEHDLIHVIAKMELRGIEMDARKLADGATKLDAEIDQLEREVFTAMGYEISADEHGRWQRPFDLNSNAKVAKQLFLDMGLAYDPRSVGKPNKDFPNGVPSVSKKALQDLRSRYEVVDNILKHSEACHMRDSFLKPLPEHVDPKTGYIHGSFNQTGAPTGRFSHSNPNLAQLPVKDD